MFKKQKEVYDIFDMSTKESRERNVSDLYREAVNAKEPIVQEFKQLNEIYHNDITMERAGCILWDKENTTYIPTLMEGRTQVESQIDTSVPSFAFKGRDGLMDENMAKVREEVVRFIAYRNNLKTLVIDNERHLNKYGNAFMKVAFDSELKGIGYTGDITIGNPSPAYIFPDPNAYTLDDCEYIIYAYRLHKRKVQRLYGKKAVSLKTDNNEHETEIFKYDADYTDGIIAKTGITNTTVNDCTMQVIEYWYRDDEGDIACSIQIDGQEVHHIPKYWIDTKNSGNQMYPFIHFKKTPVDMSFWAEGELKPIIPLINSANEEYQSMINNHRMVGNDIVLAEEGAFEDDFEPTNAPGEIWKLKANKMGRVQRAGGIVKLENASVIQQIQAQIEKVNGNAQSSDGVEPSKVTTFRGIMELNSRADKRQEIKNAGRMEGFKRLYQLIDWTALEFYNTDRVVMITGDGEQKPTTPVLYNRDRMSQIDELGQQYFPTVDVEVIVGKGLDKSPQMVVDVLQQLIPMLPPPANLEIVKRIIDELGVQDSDTIKGILDGIIQQQMQPQQAGEIDPNELFNNLSEEEKDELSELPPEEQDAVLDDMLSRIGG